MSNELLQRVESSLQIYDQSPHLVFWKDLDLRYMLMNEVTARLCGHKSSAISYEGITDHDHPSRVSELADDFEKHDRLTIRSKKQISTISFCLYATGEWRILMGHRYPLYDSQKQIAGVNVSAIDITDCPIMRNALLLVSENEALIGRNITDLTPFTYLLTNTYEEYDLSLRESECLFLLIRGKTAKETANILNISYRTVEKHIDKIKFKMKCFTKSAIIDTALQNGAGSIIPKSILATNNAKR